MHTQYYHSQLHNAMHLPSLLAGMAHQRVATALASNVIDSSYNDSVDET